VVDLLISVFLFIRGLTNTTTYIQYLQAAFRSHLRHIDRFSFIHDRPTWAHTVLAHYGLRTHRITCVDNYPPVNPDLNAVESVWSWMNRYVQRHHPNSQKHLERLVQQAWNMIPQNVIRGYINNIPNICEHIIADHD